MPRPLVASATVAVVLGVACSSDPAASSECVVRAAATVACGPATCSGSTPACCKTGDGALSCIAAAGSCRGTGRPEDDDIFACDETGDCPAGQVCCALYDKTLARRTGTQCVVGAACPPAAGQACRVGCECASGTCSAGYCT